MKLTQMYVSEKLKVSCCFVLYTDASEVLQVFPVLQGPQCPYATQADLWDQREILLSVPLLSSHGNQQARVLEETC